MKRHAGSLFEAPEHVDVEGRRYYFLANVVGILGFISHVVIFLAFLYFEIYLMAVFNIGSLLLFATAYVVNQRGLSHLSIYIGIAEIVIHGVVATILLGWDTHFYLYLSTALILSFLTRQEYDRLGIILNAGLILSIVTLYIHSHGGVPSKASIHTDTVHFFSIMNLVTSFTVTGLGAMYYKYTSNDIETRLNEAYQNITDSIRYAKRIQNSVLPDISQLAEHVSDVCLFYRPCDIVSGDFYWYKWLPKQQKLIVASIDCTGHGVPGAFMTIIADMLLEGAVVGSKINRPHHILSYLHTKIQELLKQKGLEEMQDGMDVGISVIDYTKKEVEYAGARHQMIYIKGGQLYQSNTTRRSIGGWWIDESILPDFTSETISFANEPLRLYFLSDGYTDQFGGPRAKKFNKGNFRQLLIDLQKRPVKDQGKLLEKAFDNWKGTLKQTDDVLVLGLEVR